MLSLDIQSITVTLIAANAVQAALLLLVYFVTPRYGGVLMWVLAGVVSVAGFALLLLRDRIPDFFSIVVANGLLLGGTLLLHRGILRFIGRASPLQNWLTNALFCATLLAFLPFTYVLPNTSARTLLISGAIAMVHHLNSWNLLRATPPGLRLSGSITGAVIGAYSVWLWFRGLLAVVGAPMQSVFQPTTLQAVHFLIVLTATSLWTAGLAVMCVQRSVRDLRLGRSGERAAL